MRKILNFIPALLAFLEGAFSDGGNPSYSRLASGAALLASIRWIDKIVAHTQQIPDLFNVLILVGGLYGINRLPDIMGAFASFRSGAVSGTKTESVATVSTVTATTK